MARKKRKKKAQLHKLTVRVPKDVQRALERAADGHDRSINSQVVQYLRYCLMQEGALEGEVQLELLR